MAKLRDRFVERVSRVGGVTVNGAAGSRLPNTANLRFAGAPGDAILARSPGVAASLELAAPLTMTKEKIVLGFEHDSFEDARAEQTAAQEVLTTHARAFFGAATVVTFEIAERGSKMGSVAFLDQKLRKQREAEARMAVEKHDLVQKVKTLFDAELRDIKIPPQED